jgi:hypothetical protein
VVIQVDIHVPHGGRAVYFVCDAEIIAGEQSYGAIASRRYPSVAEAVPDDFGDWLVGDLFFAHW